MSQNHPLPVSIGDIYKRDIIYMMPLYQRPYCWTSKKELLAYKRDLQRIFETATQTPPEQVFLGAIILQREDKSSTVISDRYTVIDGQQRLTTIYLTLAAMAEYAYEKGFSAEAKALIQKYMVSQGVGTEDKPKLESTNLDRQQLNDVLQDLNAYSIKLNPGAGEKKGNLLSAYNFIKESIVKALILEMDSNETYHTFTIFMDSFLENFVIADITLDSSHDPNEVFDRLNTKGIKLGIVDLIRNNLFKEFSGNQANSQTFYNSTWLPFEKKLKTKHRDTKDVEKQVDNFFFPYALNQENTITKQNVVSELRKNWGSKSSVDIVKDMEDFIDPYFAIISGHDFTYRIPSTIGQSLRDALVDLHQLNVPQATYPFLMRCVYEVIKKNVNESDIEECFRILESFIVRRSLVYDEEGTGYHAIFKKLWEGSKGNPAELKKKGNIHTTTKVFPTDKEFEKAILEKGIYGKTIEKYLLMQYEEHLATTAFEVYPNQHIETSDHILAQSLGKKLKGAQKDEFERTLNLWGNILPMSRRLNSKKSNKKIKNIYKSLGQNVTFQTSKEWYKDNSSHADWSPTLIDKRTKKIAKWALQRWKGI